MGPPQVGFSFRAEPPSILYFSMLGSVLVYAFCFSGAILDAVFTYGESTHWGLYHCNSLEIIHGRHMCNLVMVISPHQVCTEWLLPPLLWVGGASSYSISCPPAIPTNGGAYSFGGLAESHLIPSPSLHGGEGSSFPGLVPFCDTVNSESVVGIKRDDSDVMIGYQVDEFTYTWSAEWLLIPTFILGSQVRCHYWPIFPW